MRNTPAGRRGFWLELKGKSEGESFLVDVAQIAAFEEIQGGYRIYCGGATREITRDQKELIWELIQGDPEFNQILELKGLSWEVLEERGLLADQREKLRKSSPPRGQTP